MKAVAIVGLSPASREMANYEPDDVEIWGLRDAYLFLKRYDRWFEMHANVDFSDDTADMEFCRECDVTVYVAQDNHHLPTGKLYPYAAIGGRFRHYFTSTIAYMLAMAIHEGYDEIHLWGVDMATGSEYEFERPCCEFWLGLAAGRGITVVVPDTSPLLKNENGAYGLYHRIGMTKTQVIDALADLERQRRASTDPDQQQAINGAQQMMAAVLGKLDPRTKDAKIEYVSAGE